MTKPRTLGELKASGYRPRSVKDEMRDNLIGRRSRERRARSRASSATTTRSSRRSRNAILSRHDFILLGPARPGEDPPAARAPRLLDDGAGDRGLRAQRAIRCCRSRTTARTQSRRGARRRHADRVDPPRRALQGEAGDARRDDRRPDRRHRPDQGGDARARLLRRAESSTSASFRAPTAASSRSTSCPISQPRIQVGLLNILEEKDFQIRGFPVRLVLDMLIVFSANPEDYTNRGNDHHAAARPDRVADHHPLSADAPRSPLRSPPRRPGPSATTRPS